MVCWSTGDPHVTSFAGYKFDLMGVGVFPLFEMAEVRAQTFHCPTAFGSVDVSTNAAVALQVGGDTVVVRGQTVKLNGELQTASTTSGKVSLSIGGEHVDELAAALHLHDCLPCNSESE